MPRSESDYGYGDFFGPNFGYVIELYERYLQSPDSVDPATRAAFKRLGAPPPAEGVEPRVASGVDKARHLADAIREFGHQAAQIYPVAGAAPDRSGFRWEAFGLSPEALERLEAQAVWPGAPASLTSGLEAIRELERRYTGTLAFEYRHLSDLRAREFWREAIEGPDWFPPLPSSRRRELLHRLLEVAEFESYLHRTYPGQKRFSLEGTDTLVPLLDELIREAARVTAIRDVELGMAHRGRLNVLAHILQKPYAAIFAEFHAAPDKEAVPSEGSSGINYGWTGDVRYHLGAEQWLTEPNAVTMRVHLAHNPSHLEFVNPVVEGMARAVAEGTGKAGQPDYDPDRALPILIHGDASWAGEGVVAETLNLSGLAGYQTGGTVHVIVNNQIGFTTPPEEGRSTRYASDLAKGFEIPILHVNADDPEAVIFAAQLALRWRQRFHRDVLIDLIGYRRWGHNEGDDPAPTQPELYQAISGHPPVSELYADRLEQAGLVTREEVEAQRRQIRDRLVQAQAEVAQFLQPAAEPAVEVDQPPPPPPVSLDALKALNRELFTIPEGFRLHSRVERLIGRRQQLETPEGIDWGWAEQLAWASLLQEGIAIRLSGQDSQRGTFGQRHLVWHDRESGRTYCPLQHLPQARAAFAAYNSPLTETAVMAFEYGYSVRAPASLTIWEAQYGDFANVAQVVIDQFIAAGRAKWQQDSGLVLLLPHGYEGQGPEHSSARLERFLELSAQGNWRVAVPSTAAQYFHLLRDQAHRLPTAPRPLVVMAPKSLLRHPKAASRLDSLVEGGFAPLLTWEVPTIAPEQVRTILVASGKTAIELEGALEDHPRPWAVVRLEQLYPFPETAWRDAIARYPTAEEVRWVQEEPENMGALPYLRPILDRLVAAPRGWRAVSRPPRPTPAEGFHQAHRQETLRIMHLALED